MESVKEVSRKGWNDLVQIWVRGGSVLTNEGVSKSGEEMEERSRF